MKTDILSGVLGGPTPDQVASALGAGIAKRIAEAVPELLRQMIAGRNRLHSLLWNSPDAIGNRVPPQAIADGLGTVAASVFAHDAALAAFLRERLAAAGVDSATIAKELPGLPEGYSFTENPDGTVTIQSPAGK